MKKLTILIFGFSFSMTQLFAQATIKKIKDPHIRAQQQRMVFAKWGDWLPKGKYFLGLQLNIHHTMTWGWMAPNQNDDYRRGADIRPLGPAGEQTQRMALNTMLKSTSDKYKEYTDSIARDATSELYNTSGLFSTLDPLWRLYYSKELDEVINYDRNSLISILSNDQRIYLTQTGGINWYDEQMLIMQEKLNAAFNQDIDRGSRVINYHNLLIEFRKLRSVWDAKLILADRLKPLYEKNNSMKSPPITGFTTSRSSDVEIMRAIMNRIQNKREEQ